jgi:hypothetical protein
MDGRDEPCDNGNPFEIFRGGESAPLLVAGVDLASANGTE